MRNGEERQERRERGGRNGKYHPHRDMQTKQNALDHNPIIPKNNLCKQRVREAKQQKEL